jgi:linoleoyl-CoA desaturase
MHKVSFDNTNNQFFRSLKSAVDQYFKDTGKSKTGDWRLYLKGFVLMPLAVGLYVTLLTVNLPAAVALTLCAMLGMVIASIGFNIMHDACHGSYSSRKWVNGLLGLSLNALGGNAFFWKQKHNILHHTYTNIEGADDDIAQSRLLRQSPTQEWLPVHRYQHIYLTLAYGMTLFMWVGFRDFDKYFSKKIHNTPLQPMNRQEHITFWCSKAFYAFFYVALPIMVLGFASWLTGFLVMNVVAGIVLAYTFQLAHAVEGPEFDSVGIDEKKIESEWAIHQVRTTANFCPQNKVINWFAGGLNYQIEHHLFPRIAHIHYPALSTIVQEHCRKYDLPYHSFNSLSKAVSSHVATMKELGKKPG